MALFGAKLPSNYPLTVKQLRELVAQLDAAGVNDYAVIRGRTRMGGRMIELTVNTSERSHGHVREDLNRPSEVLPATKIGDE